MGGQKKKLGRKDLAKKNTGAVRNIAKLHMYRRHNFKKKSEFLKQITKEVKSKISHNFLSKMIEWSWSQRLR